LIGIMRSGYPLYDLAVDELLVQRHAVLWSATAARLIEPLLRPMIRGEVVLSDPAESNRIELELGVLGSELGRLVRANDFSQGPAVLSAYEGVVALTRSGVVMVLDGEVQVALGTVVGDDGWVVTKASELPARPKCRLPDGSVVESRVVARDPQFDLALLQISADSLRSVTWAESYDPEVGTLLAAAGPDSGVLGAGVVSVARRDLAGAESPEHNLPLRVRAAPPEIDLVWGQKNLKSGLPVLVARGRASSAGLRRGDIVRAINGNTPRTPLELMELIGGHTSGDLIDIDLERGGRRLTVRLPLQGAGINLSGNYRLDDQWVKKHW
jgi:serine protease Do